MDQTISGCLTPWVWTYLRLEIPPLPLCLLPLVVLVHVGQVVIAEEGQEGEEKSSFFAEGMEAGDSRVLRCYKSKMRKTCVLDCCVLSSHENFQTDWTSKSYSACLLNAV